MSLTAFLFAVVVGVWMGYLAIAAAYYLLRKNPFN